MKLKTTINKYLASPDFLTLSPSTQDYYRRHLTILGSRAGGLSSELRGAEIARLLSVYQKHPGAYNKARASLSACLSWAGVDNQVSDISTKETGSIKRWPRIAAETALQRLDGDLKTAAWLMYETMQRLSDVVNFRPNQIERFGDIGKIRFIQQKTGTEIDAILSMRLLNYLDSLGVHEGHCYIGNHPIPTRTGQLQKAWARRREQVLHDLYPGGCSLSLHGLRKAGACEAAEGGASPLELQSALGHKTLRASMIYIEEVNRGAMAANALSKRNLGV